jgi:AraC-like DNA-binding protein
VNPKVRVAVRFVEETFHRDIYVAEVAELVKLSPSRFCHLFKSEMGMSFGQYLKNARMEKARQLLETSFEPIKAIAPEVGYKDASHFEREFKKNYGMTPSQYRADKLG